MTTRPAPERDLELYATIVAELALGARDRSTVLAEHGLDEARWEAVDSIWQTRLSADMDRYDGQEAGVPALVSAYAEALDRAQRRLEVGPPLSLEKFAEATGQLRRESSPAQAFAKAGVTVELFLRANQYWTRRISADAELAARFARLVR